MQDLVNNLNYDNEVLQQSVEDLKLTLVFIVQQHKQLKSAFEKEKANRQVVEA